MLTAKEVAYEVTKALDSKKGQNRKICVKSLNSNNVLTSFRLRVIMVLAQKVPVIVCQIQGRIMHEAEKYTKGRRNASGP